MPSEVPPPRRSALKTAEPLGTHHPGSGAAGELGDAHRCRLGEQPILEANSLAAPGAGRDPIRAVGVGGHGHRDRDSIGGAKHVTRRTVSSLTGTGTSQSMVIAGAAVTTTSGLIAVRSRRTARRRRPAAGAVFPTRFFTRENVALSVDREPNSHLRTMNRGVDPEDIRGRGALESESTNATAGRRHRLVSVLMCSNSPGRMRVRTPSDHGSSS